MRLHRCVQALATAAVAAVVLTACEAELEEDPQNSGSGQGPGGMSQMQAVAPEPTGSQYNHEAMREAVEAHVDTASITDTDDWWGSLRDINRELQKLRVRPTDCKSLVTASALPVPAGALAVIADRDSGSIFVHSFKDAAAAGAAMNSEIDGADSCAEHTVIRDLGEEEFEARTTLTDIRIRSGADEHLAVRREVEADGETQRDLAVVLRHDTVISGAVQPLEEEIDRSEAEDLVVELEAQAAAVLSELLDEEITPPDPEPEDEDDAEEPEEEDSGDGEQTAETSG